MRRARLALLLAAGLLSPAAAADYEDGLDAVQLGDYRAAFAEFARAAAEGDLRAANALGELYERGDGVEVDKVRAAEWYRRAAEAGNREAQYNLAGMFRSGDGVPLDARLSMQWYRRAAEQGLPIAQFFVGKNYEHGMGTEQDVAEAWAWYALAAEAGDGGSAANRDRVARYMDEASLRRGRSALAAHARRLGLSEPRLQALGVDANEPPAEAATPADRGLVRDLQRALAELGYDVGEIDGLVGRRTESALGAFAAGVGMEGEPRVDEAMLAQLRAAITARREAAEAAPAEAADVAPAETAGAAPPGAAGAGSAEVADASPAAVATSADVSESASGAEAAPAATAGTPPAEAADVAPLAGTTPGSADLAATDTAGRSSAGAADTPSADAAKVPGTMYEAADAAPTQTAGAASPGADGAPSAEVADASPAAGAEAAASLETLLAERGYTGGTARADFARDVGLPTDSADARLAGRLRALAPLLPAPAAERALVSGIQAALARQGYDPGPVDGLPGSLTRAAVARFAEDRGLAAPPPLSVWLGALLAEAAQPDAETVRPAASPVVSGAAAGELPPLEGEALVRAVQQALAAAGYDPGPVDGLTGPRTRRAAAEFRAARGLAGGNAIDAALLSALREPPVAAAALPAATGDPVRDAQTLLDALGFDVGGIDGIVGTRTRNAVLAFERAQGRDGDAAIDDALLSRLRAATSAGGAGGVPLDEVQQALLARGYQPGRTDGRQPAGTREALAAFQADQGLQVTGQADLPTLARLRQAPRPLVADSALVRDLQAALAARGHDPGPADGALGPRTRAAVDAFRRAEGLPAEPRLDRALLHRLGL